MEQEPILPKRPEVTGAWASTRAKGEADMEIEFKPCKLKINKQNSTSNGGHSGCTDSGHIACKPMCP